MKFIWLSLIIYAVVEAIVAAYKVSQKHRINTSVQPFTQSKQDQSSSVQSASPAAIGSDRDKLHQSSNQDANELSILQPKTSLDLDLPLAASISISEVVHPETRSPSAEQFDLDLSSPELSIASLETVKSGAPRQVSVLAEISQLDNAELENEIAQFQRHLNHPDDTIRAAMIFELGEVAAKHRGVKTDEIREMLMQLSQDPNPSIRTQVGLALTKIESVLS